MDLVYNSICTLMGFGSLLIGLFIKVLPNFLFNKINFLKEDELEIKKFDCTITSLLRKRTSVRYM